MNPILVASILSLILALTLAGCGGEEPTAPGAAAVQAPASQPAPDSDAAAGLEALLSGETLARYRTLPPGYREALQVYVFVGVPSDLIPAVVQDKIDQWGGADIPLAELVGDERANRFRGLELPSPIARARALGSYYVFLLNTEPNPQRRSDAMRQLIDEMAPSPPQGIAGRDPDEVSGLQARSAAAASWPNLESFLTPTALAQLDGLGHRLQKQVQEPISGTGRDDVANVATFATQYELFLLKARPGLELPLMQDTLNGAALARFRALPAVERERADLIFQHGVFVLHYLPPAENSQHSTIPDPAPDRLAEQARFALDFVTAAPQALWQGL